MNVEWNEVGRDGQVMRSETSGPGSIGLGSVKLCDNLQ